MFIYAKWDDAGSKAICNDSIPLDCVPNEIASVLKIREGSDLHGVLMALAKCEIPASKDYCYVAWLRNDGYVAVRYSQKRADYTHPTGIMMTGFQGIKIRPEDVEEYVRRTTLKHWIELCQTGMKEVGFLVSIPKK